MKSIATFLATSLFAVCALGAEPANRPIGVEPESWIPLADNLGFVVLATTEPAIPPMQGAGDRQVLLNKVSPEPPAAGYFMIKGKEGWRRVIVMSAAEIASATKR
jgi:hypothetical protein